MGTQSGLLLPRLDSDGKQVVYATPSTPGWNTWIASAGDDKGPPIVRGGGTVMKISWDANDPRGEKSVTLQFAEPVQLHDGGAVFDPTQWSIADLVNFSCVLDATAVTPDGMNTGDCNLVDAGGYHVIVPANGNGAYNVDLSAAVPIPAPDNDGYWDADYDTGVITPSTSPGNALFHLLDVPVENAIVRNVIFHNQRGQYDLPAYGVEWVHPNWKLVARVNKQSAGAGTVAGFIRCFRRNGRV